MESKASCSLQRTHLKATLGASKKTTKKKKTIKEKNEWARVWKFHSNTNPGRLYPYSGGILSCLKFLPEKKGKIQDISSMFWDLNKA